MQVLQSIEYRNLAPLYCDEEMRVCGMEKKTLDDGSIYDVWIEGPTGGVAVKGTVRTIARSLDKSTLTTSAGKSINISTPNEDQDLSVNQQPLVGNVLGKTTLSTHDSAHVKTRSTISVRPVRRRKSISAARYSKFGQAGVRKIAMPTISFRAQSLDKPDRPRFIRWKNGMRVQRIRPERQLD